MLETLRYDWRRRGRLALVAAALAATGCHGLLEVSDPTLIRSSDIANVSGANSQRINASSVFMNKMVQIAQDVAYFTDEWTRDIPATAVVTNNLNVQLDQRNSEGIERIYGAGSDPHLGGLSNMLWQTSIAIGAVRAYSPDSLRGDYLAQLYGLRGYLILQMAEDICPGFPVNDVADNQTVYGGPLTTDSAVALASAALDSALKYGQDSARFITLARVAKGRALLDLGHYAEAAAAVATVPTDSVYASDPLSYMVLLSPRFYSRGAQLTGLGNDEGTNGLGFVSENDPRVPLHILGVGNTSATDTLYYTTKGIAAGNTFIYASGIEARLIQAEAALHANQPWKPILDTLRATVGLDSLTDPGTDAGRVDLIYHERAFWLFMTGRRLGDLRRLIKNYGRGPETVFPTGVWHGGTGDHYGTGTAIPFSYANQAHFNSKITTGCTTR